MNFLSVCSGIEAASQATATLGWSPVAFSEIEPFPCALLAHRHPTVPNLGDMTLYPTWDTALLARADILMGGTPCQAFSVAGERQSLADDRGNLTLTLCHLYDHLDQARHLHGRPPALLLWENVPGVLNTEDNAFGCFLAGLAGEDRPLSPPGDAWLDAGYVCGPKRALAWRVLDAQYFGLAQRRRRVFLVAGPRDGFHPEQVLFEFTGLRRDSPPGRETREGTPAGTLRSTRGGSDVDHARAGHLIAPPITTSPHADNLSEEGKLIPEISYALSAGHAGSKFGSVRHNQDTFIPEVCGTLLNGGKTAGSATNQDAESGLLIPETAHTLRAEGFDASEDGTGRGTPLIPELIAFPEYLSGTQYASTADLSPSLQAQNPTAIAFSAKDYGADATEELCPTLRAGNHDQSHANSGSWMGVVQPLPFDTTQITSKSNVSHPKEGDPCHPLASGAHPPAIAFSARMRGDDGRGYNRPPQVFDDIVGALDTMKPHCIAGPEGSVGTPARLDPEPIAFNLRGREGGAMAEPDPDNIAVQRAASGGSSRSYIATSEQTTANASGASPQQPPTTANFPSSPAYRVRRLTPTECERLQGFPDGHTRIPWRKATAADCPDGPRYKALGNSWAVPVVTWICRRIPLGYPTSPSPFLPIQD